MFGPKRNNVPVSTGDDQLATPSAPACTEAAGRRKSHRSQLAPWPCCGWVAASAAAADLTEKLDGKKTRGDLLDMRSKKKHDRMCSF